LADPSESAKSIDPCAGNLDFADAKVEEKINFIFTASKIE